jgi:hypothetical protein
MRQLVEQIIKAVSRPTERGSCCIAIVLAWFLLASAIV